MKIIETNYNGYRFRSRTEARWAVFFDEIYVKYEYEKDGFILFDGTPYLPDFYLPQLKCWIEIKGDIPTEEEINKCRMLNSGRNEPVILIHGIPDPNTALFYYFSKDEGEIYFAPCRHLEMVLSDLVRDAGVFRGKNRIQNALHELRPMDNEYTGDEYAFQQAKSARFGGIA